MQTDLETKLAAARTRLILDKPFLGALVLRLPVVEADPAWCPTTATDARRFYFNPDYIAGLSLSETEFILAHEALHCALSHFARRQHRVKARWDVACDYAVNPLLVDDGLTPPPNTLLEESFEGMAAEEIYPYIVANDSAEPMDRHVYDSESDSTGGSRAGCKDGDEDTPRPDPARNGAGKHTTAPRQDEHGSHQPGRRAPQPPPLSEDERELLRTQWQQRLAAAAQQAIQAGKLGGKMARLVDHLLQPQQPWRSLLARYMTATARDDFSYLRPSRREGAALFPSLRSAQIDVAIGIDTSGSINDRELREFLAEVDAIKAQTRARITLLECDAEISPGSPRCFEPWEPCSIGASIRGGGGTRFTPVFEWVERQDQRPDLLVYFTDANGQFPDHAPPYPVLWLVKGKQPVPWGHRIQLN